MSEMTSNKPYLVRAIYDWIIDNGLTVHLAVDVAYPGVEVPLEYVDNGQIVLNVTPHAVHGFDFSNDQIAFSARFGGVPRHVCVPVPSIMAVFAKENGQGMAFEIELPPDDPVKTDPEKGKDKPRLKVVK